MTTYRLPIGIEHALPKWPLVDFRKNSLADFRENPDFDNLSPWEKVPQKKPGRFRGRGDSIFLGTPSEDPPFMTKGYPTWGPSGMDDHRPESPDRDNRTKEEGK